MRKAGAFFLALFLGGAALAASAVGQTSAGAATLEEGYLNKALLDKTGKRPSAVDYVVQYPGSVHPFYLASVVEELWSRGDRRQAAFWYYIFQSRSRPWAETDPGLRDLRGALDAGMGQAVNLWAASDLDAWHEIGARAIAYEKKLPLYPGMPNGLSAPQWEAAVATWRRKYEDGFTSAFPKTAEDRRNYQQKRRQNGLYVGPLQYPGKPLPNDWR